MGRNSNNRDVQRGEKKIHIPLDFILDTEEEVEEREEEKEERMMVWRKKRMA